MNITYINSFGETVTNEAKPVAPKIPQLSEADKLQLKQAEDTTFVGKTLITLGLWALTKGK